MQNIANFLVAVSCLSLAGIIALALFATFCKLFKLIVIDPIVNWVNKPRSLNNYTGSTGPGTVRGHTWPSEW